MKSYCILANNNIESKGRHLSQVSKESTLFGLAAHIAIFSWIFVQKYIKYPTSSIIHINLPAEWRG